jgi:5-methylcytosine-specific restriction endonuclease McrA
VRLPTPKRTKDKALLKSIRKPYCEFCRYVVPGLEVHHIISKGSGGPDARENLITLCRLCHLRAHAGEIDKAALWAIVARREGITPEEAESEARELTRRAHCG